MERLTGCSMIVRLSYSGTPCLREREGGRGGKERGREEGGRERGGGREGGREGGRDGDECVCACVYVCLREKYTYHYVYQNTTLCSLKGNSIKPQAMHTFVRAN